MDSFKSLKDHVYQYMSGKINDGSLLPETKSNETKYNTTHTSLLAHDRPFISVAAGAGSANGPSRWNGDLGRVTAIGR